MGSELDGLFNMFPNNLDIKMNPEILIELLRVFNLGKEFSPIGVEFFDNMEFRIRIKHPSGDSNIFFIGNHDSVNGKGGYLVLDPKETLELLIKYKDSDEMSIFSSDSKQTHFEDNRGNWNDFVPIDKSQLWLPFVRMIPEFKDDWFVWKKKENGVYQTTDSGEQIYETASTKITIDTKEFQKAIKDIKASDSGYAEFHFGEQSWSRSGHLGKGKKRNTSNTALEAKVEGDEWNFVLLGVFAEMIKKISGEIQIFGAKNMPFIVITKVMDYGRLIFVFKQPKEII